MTEPEWLSCSDPELMVSDPVLFPFLGLVSNSTSDRTGEARAKRKRILCSVAWLNLTPDLLVREYDRWFMDNIWKMVDGLITKDEFRYKYDCLIAKEVDKDRWFRSPVEQMVTEAANFREGLKQNISCCFLEPEDCRETLEGKQIFADILREIFGNPFHPVSLDPAWLTGTAIALATGIYDDHAFDRLPILADALQEAGCNSDDLLNHLRGPGPHVRGCWALDLVLGKE